MMPTNNVQGGARFCQTWAPLVLLVNTIFCASRVPLLMYIPVVHVETHSRPFNELFQIRDAAHREY